MFSKNSLDILMEALLPQSLPSLLNLLEILNLNLNDSESVQICNIAINLLKSLNACRYILLN